MSMTKEQERYIELHSKKNYCKWKENNPTGPMPFTWDAECGLSWYLEEGRPEDNQMSYCPKCGRLIEDIKFKKD